MNVLPMAAVLFAAAGGVVVSTEAMRSRARKELKRSVLHASSLPERPAKEGSLFRFRPFVPTSGRKPDLKIERHASELFDAVSLGMRAGLSFDAAFALYCTRFDDELAGVCRDAHRAWSTGVLTRAEALASIASKARSPTLERFAANVERNARFGSPMGRMLDALSRESSGAYRTKIEERVAKAPIEMLIPTATLILPAMLIVILGPVLLDLA